MEDVIRANTNLYLVILTVNISVWYLTKRSLVISTVEKAKQIDKLSSEVDFLVEKHKLIIKRIKIFVLLYYTFNMFNVFLIWLPLRSDISSTLYTEDPCPGLNVTKTINKHICRTIVYFQDILVTVVVINYQSLLLFLIAHTVAMYTLISEEILTLNDIADEAEVRDRLAPVIGRHILLLDIVKSLQSLYNVPIGIDFGANAYFFCLFFTLPLKDWIAFGPLLGYCFIAFFLYCFLCQKLKDSSVIFEKSVYACGWENFGVSDKKTALIVLKLSQRPVLLQAAHIIPIDINTFASTVQAIYKFVTALKV
ncbi:uncharacterized protein LOC121731856 [Aricia agestis]|uniref:uncharacterized protein LOC121731856 n=1 Tax=Aricia agestis TaxID=91739 RepID=UPI001C205DD4|nr:uncharacterized protein LOC121731856 [Aricia agestis]